MTTEPAERHPIDEGWIKRGAPIDHIGRHVMACAPCGDVETLHDGYRVIFGGHTGLGAPAFVRPFLKRQSTRGKLGNRSQWWSCTSCGSLTPGDGEAVAVASRLGMPDGFIATR